MNKLDKYVRAALWFAAGADLVWFIASKWSMYALLWFFVLVALALAWWGLRFPISDKARATASLIVVGFWTIILFLLFFPFPVPDVPQYIVGEVHRFSELEHGWARAATGALGPNLLNVGHAYTDPAEIPGLDPRMPGAITTFPAARSFFGGTLLIEPFRAGSTQGGVPPTVAKYPWTGWEGDHRPTKLGWNKGDLLLGEVANQVGHEKATYEPHENTLMIKAIAKWLGASECVVAAVDPRWFYSHHLMSGGAPAPLEERKNLKYGIQIFVDQNWERVQNDPGESWWSMSKSGAAYSTSGWIAVRMAQMLRDMGYEARAGYGPFIYDTIESTYSVYGGGGEFGRLSDAVVPSAGGLRFKSAVILTDFPLVFGKPKGYGITRMCAHCDRCARACPVSSIPMGEPTVENGVKMWQVDKDKCVRFRAGNLAGNCCNECLKVCPYNKPLTAFHKLGNYIIRHSFFAPYLFGNVNGVGLEDWLEFDVSDAAGPYNVNRPARWVLEEPGFKMPLPYQIASYMYTEEDRSTAEEWSTGVGIKMGKVGLTYKGIQWGQVPSHLIDASGRSRNVHWDYPQGEMSHDMKLPGKVLTREEADALLKSGKAFTGGSNHPDSNVYPPRSPKYEKGFLSYDDAVKLWMAEK
ncbi:MAG: 4Fe-4S dicluster domain-containing protein [Terriglobales bacterium]